MKESSNSLKACEDLYSCGKNVSYVP
ncbi:unnamed protein product [Gulo gulo]|uniref:Uncharacterized protein n=1 Tax=Gulo gulo TaxID=48420 RepID=A0A9X9LSX6_GULGU|nr:unnamed protein product [Gulo gulo]